MAAMPATVPVVCPACGDVVLLYVTTEADPYGPDDLNRPTVHVALRVDLAAFAGHVSVRHSAVVTGAAQVTT